MIVSQLKLCAFSDYESFLYDFEITEHFTWLVEDHYESEKEKYEMIASAFQVGYVRAKTGKKTPMFEDNSPSKAEKITKEQKAKEWAELDKIFGDS